MQAADGSEREAEMLDWGTNRILVRAEGPGRLILSEIDYPGWQARVDNASVEIISYMGILRSVDLGDGLHEVEFRFLPQAISWGLPLSVASLLIFVFWPTPKRGKA